VPNIFFPPSGRNFFKAEFELPIGTSIETTEAMVEDLERFLNDLKQQANAEQGLVNWVSYIANGGPRFVLQHTPEPTSPHYALMVINTVKLDDIDDVIARLEGYSTVLGLVPLYLGGGPMWDPMAVAIMFGLIFATPLTLGLVPVLYSLLFKVCYKGYAYEPVAVGV